MREVKWHAERIRLEHYVLRSPLYVLEVNLAVR
jgi:hypothetical protein